MEEPVYDPSRPMPDIELAYSYKLSNCPGKTIVGVCISYPPDGATPPHRHGSCAVSAYVISGTLQNKMNDDPMTIKEPGTSWYEAPGCHHRISNNASKTEPAVIFATMVLDTAVYERDGFAALMQIDEEYL